MDLPRPKRTLDLAFQLQPGNNSVELRFRKPIPARPVSFGLRIQFADGTEKTVRSSTAWKALTPDGKSLPVTSRGTYDGAGIPPAITYRHQRLAPAWFRTTAKVGKGLKSATLRHCALGYGDPFLNGKPVSERVLSPPFTDYEALAMFETDDITGLLKQGDNALAFLVAPGWFHQVGGFATTFSYGRPRILAALELNYDDGRSENIIIAGGNPVTHEGRFSYKGFRWAEISGLSKAPDPETLRAVVVHNDCPVVARFSSSDPLLNRLWDMGVRTHLSNMHSILEDCPNREKCQWGGDLDTAREFHPQMRHYLAYFNKKDPSGFPSLHRHADHAAPFAEIPRVQQDKELISAINFFAAAERFAQLSDAIDIARPGGGHLLLAPHFPAGLDHAAGAMNVDGGGAVISSWKRNGDAIDWTVDIPKGVTVRTALTGHTPTTVIPETLDPGSHHWRLHQESPQKQQPDMPAR